MRSWVEGESDPVNKPVKEYDPVSILVSLVHVQARQDCGGSRPTYSMAGGRGDKGVGVNVRQEKGS